MRNGRQTTKFGPPVGIALVGAFATIAGIGEIVVSFDGKLLLAHLAGAPLIVVPKRRRRMRKRSKCRAVILAPSLPQVKRRFGREQYMNMR